MAIATPIGAAQTDRALCPVDRWQVLQPAGRRGRRRAGRVADRSCRQPYLRSKTAVRPWLVAIANRRIIDRLRRHTRQKSREIELSAEHETFADLPANLDVDIGRAALAGAIDKLPPDQREAIRMLKLNEMSLKEASQASGRSVAALKVATHRAIKNLRQTVERRTVVRITSDLIDALVDSVTPVRRLRPPFLRATLWLSLAAVVLGLLCIAHGVRPDISKRLRQPVFVVSMIGALATAILAALASFKLSLPDSSRWWLLLPLPALAVWVSTIGYGCLTDWVRMGPEAYAWAKPCDVLRPCC